MLGTTLFLAVAAAIFILKAKPASQDTKRSDPAAAAVTAESTPPAPPGGEETDVPSATTPCGEVRVVAEQEGEITRLVFSFPDPAGGVPAPPPSGVYDTIDGHWVLDMRGAFYGISNCHLVLEEDARVSTPGDYSPVFEISWSEYRYDEAQRFFEATLSVALFMGTMGTVPLEIRLSGKASDSLREIAGSFEAVPCEEMYLPYGQQGGFRMYR